MLHMVGQGEADGGSDDRAEPVFYSFAIVQEALVDVHDLWRRTPRVGHRALTSSWPNEMLQRADAGDYDGRGGDMVAVVPRPLPLTRAEVARRDAVSAWVEHVTGDDNRRIVWAATRQLAAGFSQVSWRKVAFDLRMTGRRGVLSSRYSWSITAICAALNHGDAAKMVASGAKPKAIAAACGMTLAEAHALVRQFKGW
jgi:hypothetical protein